MLAEPFTNRGDRTLVRIRGRAGPVKHPSLTKQPHTDASALPLGKLRQLFENIEIQFAALTPIQQAVVRVMSEKEGDFAPFSASSMELYQKLMGEPNVSTATVQAALEALRDKNLVWRSARGVYALEDEAWAEWLATNHPVEMGR